MTDKLQYVLLTYSIHNLFKNKVETKLTSNSCHFMCSLNKVKKQESLFMLCILKPISIMRNFGVCGIPSFSASFPSKEGSVLPPLNESLVYVLPLNFPSVVMPLFMACTIGISLFQLISFNFISKAFWTFKGQGMFQQRPQCIQNESIRSVFLNLK